MKVALVTFAVGLAAGFLAQRSRLCFIGGLRDFLLIRDTDLLKGAAAFFLAAWVTFPLASLAGLPVWTPAQPTGASTTVTAPARLPAAATTVAARTPAAAETATAQPRPPQPCLTISGNAAAGLALLMVAAGLGLGATATLSNGCPLRQHVLAAQGAGDARWWLAGFYAGAVVYHAALLPLIARCLG